MSLGEYTRMTIQIEEILAAYQFRHACKEFDDQRMISAEDFDCILETARLSPSSFGLEPWMFLVIQNQQLREQLKTHTWGGQKQLPTASHVVLTLVRRSVDMHHDSDYVQNLMRYVQCFPEEIIQLRTSILEKFQRHDFDLLSHPRHFDEWSTRQTYIALGNMMTTAAMLGIDSCPIEGFEQAGVNQVLVETIGLDVEHWGVAYMVAFGYRKQAPARVKTRQTQAQVVEWLI